MSEHYDQVVPGLSQRFRWLGNPKDVRFEDRSVSMTAGPRTDWFIDPEVASITLDTPALIMESNVDFTLAVRVEPAFASSFDAGALVLWHDEQNWAKLAYEFSPQGHAMVVSVVTRGESDDCNSVVLDAKSAWLRVARRGSAHVFHYSLNGEEWYFVRHFRLNHSGEAEVGFEAQSPTGEGCAVQFSEITYSTTSLADLRSGV